MADNTAQNGTSTIATDDIGGVHYQIVKQAFGALDSATMVSTANPFPISDTDTDLGNAGGITTLRDRLVAQRYTVLSDSVADGLATFWTQSTANGGTITVSGGEGLIQTSTATNGSAQMVSTAPSYLPGQVSWMNSAIRFGDTGSAGNIRRIGPCTVSGTTPQDGFYFELSGTTLNAVVCKAGTPTATASTSWTKFSTAPFTLDTNYHSFEIRWTANRADFYIDNVLRHTVSGTTTAITSTLNFPMLLQSVNTSGATNRLIAVRNIGLGRFGTPETFPDGTEVGVITATDAVGASAPATSGTPLSFTPTAGSYCYRMLGNGEQTVVATLGGSVVSGFYNAERSQDTTNGADGNWVACYGKLAGTGPELEAYLMSASGQALILNVAGAKAIRIRNVLGTTPNSTITWRTSRAQQFLSLHGPLQAGAAIIGSVGISSAAADLAQTGSITAQNLNALTGTATAGSAVALGPLAGTTQISIEVLGTVTSAISVQISGTGATWETNTDTNAIVKTATAARSATITATGNYEFNTGGASYVRVTALSTWAAGTATIKLSASNGTTLVTLDSAIPTGANVIGALTANQSVNTAQINGVTPLMGNGVTGTGSQRVTIASDNTAFTVNATTTPAVATTTNATLSSAATTNATAVKGSAGNLYSITVSNTGAAAAFFKLYNKATAPTVGTDVPVLTISIPASGTVSVPFGSQGFRMATGIAFAITNLAADSDTTAVAAAQVKAMVAYI